MIFKNTENNEVFNKIIFPFVLRSTNKMEVTLFRLDNNGALS